jgi:hypothetical protein
MELGWLRWLRSSPVPGSARMHETDGRTLHDRGSERSDQPPPVRSYGPPGVLPPRVCLIGSVQSVSHAWAESVMLGRVCHAWAHRRVESRSWKVGFDGRATANSKTRKRRRRIDRERLFRERERRETSAGLPLFARGFRGRRSRPPLDLGARKSVPKFVPFSTFILPRGRANAARGGAPRRRACPFRAREALFRRASIERASFRHWIGC